MDELDQQEEQGDINPNVELSEAEETELVQLCCKFKQALIQNGQAKKQKQKDCYSYFKGEFIGGDLLPTTKVEGQQRDAQTERAQLFLPLSREISKQIYAELKLAFFPNDEDFFRVRAETQDGEPYETSLTEGFKWLFKKARLSEKLAESMWPLVWGGNTAAYPKVQAKNSFEWTVTSDGKYEIRQRQGEIQPTLDLWNCINFYPEPGAEDFEHSRWGYFTIEKLHEMKDAGTYYNLDKLERQIQGDTSRQEQSDGTVGDVSSTNDLNVVFEDMDPYIDYDFFYFPYLKLSASGESRIFRNMLVGVANETVLVKFHPNIMPRGLNPVVFGDYTPDFQSPYGTGPIEDIMPIQKIINIIWNVVLDWMATNGQKWAIREDVDYETIFGVIGSIVRTKDNPRDSVMPLSADMSEVSTLLNVIGVLKATAQALTGAGHPFQGASQVDFKKTATELTIIEEQARSISREVSTHIGLSYLKPLLQRYMYLVADSFDKPITVRVDNRTQGEKFIKVDFSILRQFDFSMEVTSVNLSQSKSAIMNSLARLLELSNANPKIQSMLKDDGKPILEFMARLEGLPNIDEFFNSSQETIQEDRQDAALEGQRQAIAQIAAQAEMMGAAQNAGLA